MTYIKIQDTEEYQEIQQAVVDSAASASAAATSEDNAYNYMIAAQAAANDNREVPAGLVNGVNKVFTASFAFVAGSCRVYLNGLRESNFVELSDTQIEISDAPKSLGFIDRVEITYIKKP